MRTAEISYSHIMSGVSRHVYVHALASSASIECIFSTYGLVWSNIRNSFDAEKAEKLVKISRFYRSEDDNQ